MSRAPTYSEQLLDPRWQRRRLEVLQRDGWRCRHCRRSDRPLHAHHIAYLRGLAPWEYEGRWLVTLCDLCHESEHRFNDAGWAAMRVEAVNAGAIAGEGYERLAETVGRLVAAAGRHGWEAVADVIARIDNMAADAVADRLDAQRGPATVESVFVMDDTARRWVRGYEVAEGVE